MRSSEAPRRSSAFDDWFAERQVYLRSGSTSRYVVLSRPFQIAVTAAAGLVVAGLAFASYGLVVNHLEAAGLRRELALAEARIGDLSAGGQADRPVTATSGAVDDAGTAQPAESESGAEQRIGELTRQLATSDAKADRLLGDRAAARADAAALRQAAETAEADRADLQTEVARLRERPPAGGEAGQDLAQIKEPDAAEADAVSTLKASLAGAEAQIAAASGADEVARIRAELRAANQRIAELEAAIRRGLAELAPPPPPPAPR